MIKKRKVNEKLLLRPCVSGDGSLGVAFEVSNFVFASEMTPPQHSTAQTERHFNLSRWSLILICSQFSRGLSRLQKKGRRRRRRGECTIIFTTRHFSHSSFTGVHSFSFCLDVFFCFLKRFFLLGPFFNATSLA